MCGWGCFIINLTNPSSYATVGGPGGPGNYMFESIVDKTTGLTTQSFAVVQGPPNGVRGDFHKVETSSDSGYTIIQGNGDHGWYSWATVGADKLLLYLNETCEGNACQGDSGNQCLRRPADGEEQKVDDVAYCTWGIGLMVEWFGFHFSRLKIH